MKNKRNIMRIGTLIIILMFLLVPLMSSNVAADFTQTLGSVWTNNTLGGPTAGGTIVGPVPPVGDTPPYDIDFSVDYTYTDSNTPATGSYHWIIIIVYYQPGGVGAWVGPVTFTQTPITLAAGASATGTYTTNKIFGYGGLATNFLLNVVVNCQDISSTSTFTWTSAPVTFWI